MQIMYALWPDKNLSPSQRREVLLDTVAAKILQANVRALRMNIDDEQAQVKSPAPKWYKGDALVATVAVEIADNSEVTATNIKQMLQQAGFVVGQYQVDTSIYKDYGDNIHFRKRDWPDGERSPVIMAITLLTKPKKYSQSEWIRRWHGNMSPKSEVLQPRARYVRNVVIGKTADSPAFDGIVEEAWPSAKHIHNPYLFYCAKNFVQLIWHQLQMIAAIMHFHQIHKIRTVTMSEYLIKTPKHSAD